MPRAVITKKLSSYKDAGSREPDNIDLIFWGMYTAPNFEWAESLFERAKRVDPDHAALSQGRAVADK